MTKKSNNSKKIINRNIKKNKSRNSKKPINRKIKKNKSSNSKKIINRKINKNKNRNKNKSKKNKIGNNNKNLNKLGKNKIYNLKGGGLIKIYRSLKKRYERYKLSNVYEKLLNYINTNNKPIKKKNLTKHPLYLYTILVASQIAEKDDLFKAKYPDLFEETFFNNLMEIVNKDNNQYELDLYDFLQYYCECNILKKNFDSNYELLMKIFDSYETIDAHTLNICLDIANIKVFNKISKLAQLLNKPINYKITHIELEKLMYLFFERITRICILEDNIEEIKYAINFFKEMYFLNNFQSIFDKVSFISSKCLGKLISGVNIIKEGEETYNEDDNEESEESEDEVVYEPAKIIGEHLYEIFDFLFKLEIQVSSNYNNNKVFLFKSIINFKDTQPGKKPKITTFQKLIKMISLTFEEDDHKQSFIKIIILFLNNGANLNEKYRNDPSKYENGETVEQKINELYNNNVPKELSDAIAQSKNR